MAEDRGTLKPRIKKARTRHGCLNCKTKRRKCDEVKPSCSRCTARHESCEWASRLTFRAENALGIQPSLLHRTPGWPPKHFRIKDVTAEVIRDYQHDEPRDEPGCGDQPDSQQATTPGDLLPTTVGQSVLSQNDSCWQLRASFSNSELDSNYLQSHGYVTISAPASTEAIWDSPVATTCLDDTIFLPGSAYLNAHSTFRSHLKLEARSSVPTPEASSDSSRTIDIWSMNTNFSAVAGGHSLQSPVQPILSERLNSPHPSTLQLSAEEEFELWKNWLDEIAPWIDKFDGEQHFQRVLPVLARSHDHLRYSMLALSARQLEIKNHNRHTERSLALYQAAIQLVLPELHTRSTPVIASCVVLCVLEMQSSSAKAWHQHLDGCAHLIEAVGINGFSGGLDQALFWCFARMDVCGGLIASSKTLIPVERWASGIDLDADVHRFRANKEYNTHACEAVYLCAQILDLLSFHPNLAGRVGVSLITPEMPNEAFAARWLKIWNHVTAWYNTRPAEMLPIASITSSTSPFPKILYSNPAAISGNQLYHTASILMLRHKPAAMAVTPKPNSIFWHARQICGISMSNDNHGAWTNAIQPLWIAGQWMSHESEQKAILELLERIEKQSGWSTKWRAEDLKEFWG
ncbi:iq and hect domain-containing protein [Curvularia clavata]|uniref:Iq and hect domain-containing protein n=1 Tax=Curvularia clavata TaxID=95742 RepID=A0A9Q8ZHF8_CURCL|nr:iq and hect domain-containing protein [Curvularia clavata]